MKPLGNLTLRRFPDGERLLRLDSEPRVPAPTDAIDADDPLAFEVLRRFEKTDV